MSRSRPRWAPQVALLVALAVPATSCTQEVGFGRPTAPHRLPATADSTALGTILGHRFVREPAAEKKYALAGADGLVTDGRFFSIRQGTVVDGSLQIARFAPDVDNQDEGLVDDIERSLGSGFHTFHVGTARIRERVKRDQRIYLWFPPEREVMVAVITRAGYSQSDLLVVGIVARLRQLPLVVDGGPSSGPLVAAPSPSGAPAPGGGTGASPLPTPTVAPPAKGCTRATYRSSAVQSSAYSPLLSNVPPGSAGESVEVESRVAVHNTTSTAQDYRVVLRRDDAGGAELGTATASIPAGAHGYVSVRWPASKGVGMRAVAFVLTGPGVSAQGRETYTVRSAGGRAPARLQAVWIDPLGLSGGVYPRRCPVTEASLRAMVDGIAAMGADSVILTYPEYLGTFFYPSRLQFYDRDVKRKARGMFFGFDVVGTVLDQADRNGLHVFVGLGRSGDTNLIADYGRSDFEQRLATAIDVSVDLADELWARYGRHPAFYGWYLTHETNVLDQIGRYYDPVARHLDRFGADKPVLVAPTGNPDIRHEALVASEVDVFAYQDAVGAGYDNSRYTYDPEVRMAQLDQQFRAYADNHRGTGKHLWSDLEAWEMDGTQGYAGAYPAGFNRVRRQIDAERRFVDVLSVNEWTGFLEQPNSATPLEDARAAALYRDYVAWLRGTP